ncbi:Fc.00g104120.m01.CDS01 [Cosmosporella sp. VM-42]
MASWADITDLGRHFEIEVPRRALGFPVLRYAVLAFSSRHLNRHMIATNTEALEYYNKCLGLLIESVSEQGGQVSEEVLAAIAILRQYEEMDADDRELHLAGTIRIVNSMSIFDFNGGLGEAAAWLCLREDIYVSLVKQCPLRTNLDTFLQSEVFQRTDDAAYACRMVFLLAKVLSCAFSGCTPCPPEQLEGIRAEVDAWFESKPPSFNPIRDYPRNREEGRLLPEIWVLSAFHAIGIQYYHIAQIILVISTPLSATSVYENIRQGSRVEHVIRSQLLRVMGLASSNGRADNTFFTARHVLSTWGGVFRNRDDQHIVEAFLEDVQHRTGWNTAQLRSSLKQQWAVEHEDEC